MSEESDNLIGYYEVRRDFPNSDHALDTLKSIATLIKPIMVKHGFRLERLSELWEPSHPTLWGLNGYKDNDGDNDPYVELRMRDAYNNQSWIDYDYVLDVALHELCHCEHREHNSSFYRLLTIIRAEFKALRHYGWSGDGFPRLGVSGKWPLDSRGHPDYYSGPDRALPNTIRGGHGRVLGEEDEAEEGGNQCPRCPRQRRRREAHNPPPNILPDVRGNGGGGRNCPGGTCPRIPGPTTQQDDYDGDNDDGGYEDDGDDSEPTVIHKVVTPWFTVVFDPPISMQIPGTAAACQKPVKTVTKFKKTGTPPSRSSKPSKLISALLGPRSVSAEAKAPKKRYARIEECCPGARPISRTQWKRVNDDEKKGFRTVTNYETAKERAMIKAAVALLEFEEKEGGLKGNAREIASLKHDFKSKSLIPKRRTPKQSNPYRSKSTPTGKKWACQECTYRNPADHVMCICGYVRPEPEDYSHSKAPAMSEYSKSWQCLSCDEFVSARLTNCTQCGCPNMLL